MLKINRVISGRIKTIEFVLIRNHFPNKNSKLKNVPNKNIQRRTRQNFKKLLNELFSYKKLKILQYFNDKKCSLVFKEF